MFALKSRYLRRRLSRQTSGSAQRRAWERKRAQQTRAEGELLARERLEKKVRDKLEQQAQARNELDSYSPWGRAGGGAPNPQGIRYTDLRAKGIYPEDELKGYTPHEHCHFLSPRTSPRRPLAPLKLREDPQTLYTEKLKQSVDNDIRYRQTPDQQRHYKEILDEIVKKRKKAVKDELKRDRQYERKMNTMAGPWGKPGPGGAIWRNPRDIGFNFNKSMGWTDNEAFNKLIGEHKRSKRSSLTLPFVKRDDDSDNSKDKENIKPSNIEKLPDINNSNGSAGAKTKDKIESNTSKCRDDCKDTTCKVNHQKEMKKETEDSKENKERNKINNERRQSEAVVNRNEKPKKKSHSTNKFVKRLSNGERITKFIPDDKEEESYNVEKKLTPEATILRLTGGVELVPLLARRRRVGARTLPSSDITRPLDQSCEWREVINLEYLRELKHQIKMKCQLKEERRQDSADSARQHHETWASLWGRPGHGAPLRGRYARGNLAQLLYVPHVVNQA